ncbi:DUF4190 domain-containing protein [Streptomyces sp. SP17BM10]|uniref:DUF4190 domain-containing protein n=1 Tax=Streptomyces sp. SP17BM10 TaxID=3002530 RepID=UPI002E774EB9|nr:DUF4190 domain-containing protein [Streptomyces sp. SP17BM10]MEE1784064.1 DUF4190 domain-containing protein [Streptomyces sp. SP17BM10]
MSKPDPDAPVPGPEHPAPADGPPERVDLDKKAAPPAGAQQPADAPADRVDLGKTDTPPAPADAPTPADTPVADAPAPADTTPPADPWAAPTGAPPLAPPPPPPGGPAGPAAPTGGWASVPPGAYSGFQPGHPYGYPQPPKQVNGFAIGALVTGLTCTWPVAIVLAIVAMVQIRRRGERGIGMAVTGLVFGVFGVMVTAFAVLSAVVAPAPVDRAGSGAPSRAPSGSVRWSALKSGDCYSSPDGGSRTDPDGGDETVYWVRKVPCSAPHHGEVAGTAGIPVGATPVYPGESVIRQRAAELCRPVLDTYALDPWAIPDGMDEIYLYPTSGNWKSGERFVTCAFEDRDAEHVGSVRTDRLSLTSAQLAYLEAVRGFNTAYADQPKGEVATAGAEYVSWARRMAAASRTEAEQLSRTTTLWPDAAKPKVAALAAAQRDAATAWDSAARTSDPTALEGEIRRAKLLTAKTTPLSVDARRELGLSTGEQAPDLRV